MNRISEITKRDILDIFRDGIDIEEFWETKKVNYNYFGRLSEIEFLKRLYDIEEMPSLDPRFLNAEEDIIQHTINNDDYSPCWVFEDERFQLQNGSDEVYLKFICEIFHPVVRDEKCYWKEFFDKINELLRCDGYELYPQSKISNRDVYGWRIFKLEDRKMFVPYSQRNKKQIENKKINLSIKRNARNQIYQLLQKYNICHDETTETGYIYSVSTSEKVFNDLRLFYTPKCYNEKEEYVETNNLEKLLYSCSPYSVIDVIELFQQYNYDTYYETEINKILELNEIELRLHNGRVESRINTQIMNNILFPIQEAGLKELIQEAIQYYEDGNLKIAVEKMWDAFERLKTYYYPKLDKKKSANKIINDMSRSNESYIDMFQKEFEQLTKIGNNFRIRHHETNKVDIEDDRYYDYFYKRCLSLISIAVTYLEA